MDTSVTSPARQVRAVFDAESITVYQAYSREIADAALAAGTLVAPFAMNRMTWIKPSFLWMMYRCGWASKPGQERVLAIRMSRTGFETALAESCLSHFDRTLHADEGAWRSSLEQSPGRIQWDPERSPDSCALPYRSLQVGLAGPPLRHYVTEWISDVDDITDTLERRHRGIDPLPDEHPYPLPAAVADRVSATG